MSDRIFTVTLSESEKLWALYGISFLRTKMPASPVDAHLERLAKKLTGAAGQDATGGTSAAHAVLSPPAPTEPKDRWARNRKGEEVPNPEGCVERELFIDSVRNFPAKEGKAAFVKVALTSEQGRGFGTANCFDEKLFPYLANRVKQRTVLHLVKNGQYLNVVGVRA